MEVRKSPQRKPLFVNKEYPVPEYIPSASPKSYQRVALTNSNQEIVFVPSIKNWKHRVTWSTTVDQFGIESIAETFDGCPIFLVPPEQYKDVCLSFTAGTYGLDTESDYKTQELRLIQISTGYASYIFKADALKCPAIEGIPKFLKAKDRIKVGVDIETDVRRIKVHYDLLKTSVEKSLEIGGVIDLQNISRANHAGKAPLSLKDLVSSYLPEFEYKEMKHDSYLNPTIEQFIYAANDAVAPLKIYFNMTTRH